MSTNPKETTMEIQAIEQTLTDLVAAAEGTDKPATKAYLMGQKVELPIYGKATASDVVRYLIEEGHEIPDEFSDYIERELEDADSKAEAHLNAMARRGIEQVVYGELGDGN